MNGKSTSGSFCEETLIRKSQRLGPEETTFQPIEQIEET